MKIIYFFLACTIMLNQSCTSTSADIQQNDDLVDGTWNIRNINGGLAGINEDFEEGQMVWTFSNGELKVSNLETNSFHYGLENGTYPFKIEYSADKSILYIDGNEFGGISLLKEGFTIDQNIKVNGSGADGYVFVFLRTKPK